MAKPVVRDEAAAKAGHGPLVLRLRPVIELDEDQLIKLSGLNRDLRLEMTAEGD